MAALRQTATGPQVGGRESSPNVSQERERTPYEILGVASDASADEIRAAYQALVRQYHPDRVASMASEFREVAERRTKEINAAYTQLKHTGRL